ncbi:sulfurtransferase [Phormidium tenue]|uniref:Sulfurtransferase n=1 Tax=Phormidium tenue NIES-30 TaxID=549789 RepID=A0A1U7IYT4_9CYAN|nr:sulfurtransferase [Phormidium tenue]MBD2234739.1 sulfurtransferase [Phormidium tenue FACHB-1052]OKH43947.1 sulfurtransferase [Phormidium tenue NIES-30]
MLKQLQRWKIQLLAFLAAIIAVATLSGLVQPGAAATTIDFVTPQWVAQHSSDRSLRILDVRTNPLDYINSHIPGAVNIAENTFRGPNGRLPVQFWEQQKIEALFQEAGVNSDSHVVIYSEGNSILGSTQVAYLLERGSFGGEVSILDGGFKAYKDTGLPVTKEFPEYAKGNFALEDNSDIRVSLDEVRSIVRDRSARVTFIDPRPPALFAGEEDLFIRNGHIPGANNLPWPSFTVGEDNFHQLKTLDEIRALLAHREISPEDDIVVTCSTGREASLQYVVLKHLLGYPNVRLYEGAWTEYSAQPDLPVATGRDPNV